MGGYIFPLCITPFENDWGSRYGNDQGPFKLCSSQVDIESDLSSGYFLIQASFLPTVSRIVRVGEILLKDSDS